MAEKSSKLDHFICNAPDRPIVYVLHGQAGDMLIDTGYDALKNEIDTWITESGFNIKWIFLTHGHFDHSFNTKFFAEKYGADVILHEKDFGIFTGKRVQFLEASSDKTVGITDYANDTVFTVTIPQTEIKYLIKDSDTDLLRKLGFNADIIMLPGHTKGSMGIITGRIAIVGDACSAIRGDYYPTPFGSLLEEAKNSEEKFFSYNPLVIGTGHGKLIINERAF